MRSPSLQKSALVSAALHASALLLAVVVIRQPNRIVVPSPYVVSLVAPSGAVSERRDPAPAASAETKPSPAPAMKEIPKEKGPALLKEDRRPEDRIAELKAKEQLRRQQALRNAVSVYKSSAPPGRDTVSGAAGGQQHGSLFDSYYAKITNEIRSEWTYPDTGEKNLEAVIAVMIARDGSLSVQGIEKSSGSALFDRSALRALTKASPVSPPPYEMAIGIRFFP